MFALATLALSLSRIAAGGPPVAKDARLVVELVAKEPEIVTPTGITVDSRGRVWVIENNTHFQPTQYKGHATDRILVMENFTADGKAGKISVFADGLKDSMSLALGKAGEAYLVTRNAIMILRDTDGDGKADDRKTIVKLDTKATYPHNGLNGITFAPDGSGFCFCLGLNVGYPYRVIGSDGSTQAGGGEGGSMYRCGLDGSHVARIATGFWNVHDLTYDAFGRLFAVDNDPDDRPPCRLLDIIEGGDYGWQYRNGRKGVHPFTSWFGERPGTLPMVSSTGEAPSGIVAYESSGLPEEYRGQLLVTAWGDHVIQHFKLEPKGASFTSKPETLVEGGFDFRPVGIAVAPDGSLYVSDWVDKSYPVHGHGRVWHVRMKEAQKDDGVRLERLANCTIGQLKELLSHPRRDVRVAAGELLAKRGKDGAGALSDVIDSRKDDRAPIQAMWSAGLLPETVAPPAFSLPMSPAATATVRAEAIEVARRRDPGATGAIALDDIANEPFIDPYVYRQFILALPPESGGYVGGDMQWQRREIDGTRQGEDPFIAAAAITAMVRSGTPLEDRAGIGPQTGQTPVLRYLAARRVGKLASKTLIGEMLKDDDSAIRCAALQWIGEEHMTEFIDQIPVALKSGPVNRQVLEFALAAKQKLTTPPPPEGKPPAEFSGGQLAVDILSDESYSAEIRQLALQLADPRDKRLSADRLQALLTPLGIEAVRALAWREDEPAQAALLKIAMDPQRDANWRREAIAGLAQSAGSADCRATLLGRLHDGPEALRLEALRSLRGHLDGHEAERLMSDLHVALNKKAIGTDDDRKEFAQQLLLAFKPTPEALPEADRKELEALAGPTPKDEAEWQKALGEGGDADAGRRVFYAGNGARCFVCHTSNYRGGQVGPDLSHVGAAMTRQKLVESILDPSREIAPMYVPVVLELKDGTVLTGVDLEDSGVDAVRLRDSQSKLVKVKVDQIVSQRFEKISIMPANLVDAMTVREMRDLIAFLSVSK